MSDHDVQVHALDSAIAVICTCGATLGEFDMAEPGELWRLEQEHRVAIATAGPTPAVQWPSRPVTCCDCGGIEFTRWAEDPRYLQCADPDCCHVCAHRGSAMAVPQPLAPC